MAIQFRCPSCRTAITLGDDWAGKKVRCKTCDQKLLVPAPKAKASDPDEPLEVIAVPDDPPPPVAPASSENPFSNLDGSESNRRRRRDELDDDEDFRAPRHRPADNSSNSAASVVVTILFMVLIGCCLIPLRCASFISRTNNQNQSQRR